MGERRFFLREGVKRRALELVAQGCISDGCHKFLNELSPRSIFLPSLIFALEELVGSSQRPMDGPQDGSGVPRHGSPFRILYRFYRFIQLREGQQSLPFQFQQMRNGLWRLTRKE